VYGVAVTESTVSLLLGTAASWIVLAGASQISLLELISDGAAWPLAVGNSLVINARFGLYSAALAPSFVAFPRRWRYTLPYLLTDQAASLALAQFAVVHDPLLRRWWFFGAGVTFAAGWWIGTAVGVTVGASLPASLEIGFAVPAMFLALMVPTLTTRPAVVTAVVAATVVVVAAPLPNGLNILVAALAGVAAGRGAQWRARVA
jgi:predicted branched-subunit amino acid permease